MTMVTVALYALNIIELITGEPYGLFGQDVLICVTIMLTLAMKDRFTLGFNALLAKLPGKRYLSDFGLGVFIFHYPALLPFSLATREGMDVGLACWGALAATVACAVVFVVVFNKVIKPFQKWLSGVFRLDRPEGMMLAAESELAAREAQAVEEAHTADPAVVPAKPDEALRAGACVVAGEVRA